MKRAEPQRSVGVEAKTMDHDQERESARARRLEKLRFWRSACSVERPIVTHYNDAAAAPRIFFFHGDWDNGGVYMAKLAAELGSPVVSLGPHLEPVPTSIRAMAQDRLAEILAVQPEGPYRVGGFCNGALVAYEAAQLLIEQGRPVEAILLVAPPSFNAGRSYRRLVGLAVRLLGAAGPEASPARLDRAAAFMAWMTAVRRLTSYSRHELKVVFSRKRQLRVSMRRRLRQEGDQTSTDRAAEATIHQRHQELLAAYVRAVYLYSPTPAQSRLVVFGTGLDDAGLPGLGYDAAYDGRAWAELCPQAEYVPVSGDHYTCIADHAAELARAMTRALGSTPDAATWPARRLSRAGAPLGRPPSQLSPAAAAEARASNEGLEDVA